MIRRANGKDLADLKEFLSRAGLGTEGLTEEAAEYFLLLVNEDQTWRGTLGIEPYREYGLLRSLVVTPEKAESDIFLLFQHAFQVAKEEAIEHLFLATKKSVAVPLFQILGFQIVDKKGLPAILAHSAHINHILNVDNSIFLKYSL